ncbi:DUF4156 domain-containing protein [Rhodovibrio sodomensis]|uniref:DUF4156 domain-containing protein n=1 Tax=Rhodovibrio sodomensis TaxID=1088 RepID=UPI0019053622|nr:DUF4156 domain-containing protein [Rhodovibrio sodomensis]
MPHQLSKTAAVVVLLAPVIGCTSSVGSEPVDGVRQAQRSSVENCDYLGDVSGVSGLYGVFAADGLSNAKTAAQREARSMGADTVVFANPTMGHGSTSITAAAYQCKGKDLGVKHRNKRFFTYLSLYSSIYKHTIIQC